MTKLFLRAVGIIGLAVVVAVFLPQVVSKPTKTKDEAPSVVAFVDLNKNASGQPMHRFGFVEVEILIGTERYLIDHPTKTKSYPVVVSRGQLVVLRFTQDEAIPSFIWIEDGGSRVTPKAGLNVLGTISVQYPVK